MPQSTILNTTVNTNEAHAWAKEVEEKSKEADAIADSAAKLIEEASRELEMPREASKCAKTEADEVNVVLSVMNWQGDE